MGSSHELRMTNTYTINRFTVDNKKFHALNNAHPFRYFIAVVAIDVAYGNSVLAVKTRAYRK